MRKKILIGAIAFLGATSLVFASGDCNKENYKSNAYKHSSHQKSKCSHKKMDKYSKNYKVQAKGRYSHNKMFTKIFMALNLTKEQRESIKDIVKNSRNNSKMDYKRASFSQFFINGSFDKNAYIKASQKRNMAMIEARADKMDKIFAVLNKKQKEDFLVLVKANEIKRASYRDRKYQER